jgi:hypothetical protein
MDDIKQVKLKDMKTLDDYLTCLITSSASLKTLGAYQALACEKGILEDDEFKAAEAILANITHLLSIYNSQVNNIRERINVSEDEIMNRVRQVMPELKIPRKRANVRKKKNEIPAVS